MNNSAKNEILKKKLEFTREDIINGDSPMSLKYVNESSTYLLERTKHRPKIGIICGSGLAGLGDLVEDADLFPYKEVPHFPMSTAPGHQSCLLFGKLNGVPVMLMQGRFHLYEGYSIHTCAMPVRVMNSIGISILVVTNAAGGLADRFSVGDIMLIKDHVNLQGFAGINPLNGKNEFKLGNRFFSMKNAYDGNLRRIGHDVAWSLGLHLQEGVYTMMGGPNFETPAELRLMKLQGVDAVGMSTVHEVITARHCGMKVLGFSLITNICDTGYDDFDVNENNPEDLDEEVKSVAQEKGPVLRQFVSGLVKQLQDTINGS